MNVLKNFIRDFSAKRQSYFINMLSLVPGLACCLLIMMWIVGQVETDRSFKNIDRIVTIRGYHEGNAPFWGVSPAVASAIKAERPEVERAARLINAARTVKWGAESFGITAYNTDSDLFALFGLDFVEGKSFADGEKERCVLTEKAALAIFGTKSPIDQPLEFEFGTYTVCGVVKSLPKHRTVAMSGREEIIFLPIEQLGEQLNEWYNNGYETYALLRNMAGYDKFAAEIKDRAMVEHPENKLYIKAGKLSDRYLYENGYIKNVRLMGIIAFVILMIACINFVNLSTAAFSRSAVQTGIRKVIGATRGHLVSLYLLNTFLLVLISYLLALWLAYMILPLFAAIVGTNFQVSDLLRPEILWIGMGMVVVTTLLAGLYPSCYLSSFEPAKVLKSRSVSGMWSARLRQMLVVAQFAVSVTLIICTFIIVKQIRMYHTMDLGYNWNEVVYISLRNAEQEKKAFVLKEELRKESGVQSVSVSTATPTSIFWNGVGWNWEGKDPLQNPLISFTWADEDWGDVYDIRMQEGEFFTKNYEGVVINRKMAELMGGGDVTGKFLLWNEVNYKIAGVMECFRFNDFKAEEGPLVIMPMIPEYREAVAKTVSVRISGERLGEIQGLVVNRAKEVFGEEPVVRFLDEGVARWLEAEEQSSRMVSFFSVLAVIISCLGLFGLATFRIEQRRKEIGIRRVNGAKVGEIIWLLNVNFIKPVLLGFLIACPLSYYFMSGWLETYLQRTEISWWLFLLAGFVTVFISVITLVWRSMKAATENPVKSLRSE